MAKNKLKLIEKVSEVTQLDGVIVDSLESNNPTKNATSIRVVKEIKNDVDQIKAVGASKNMVNVGYDIQTGNSFSNYSSDAGIEIAKIEGNSVQETTNGYQLFDASKLPTKSQGGATVTNNGDGSFTVSGSGNLTSEFLVQYDYSVELTKKLLKTGNISFGVNGNVSGVNVFVKLVDKTNQKLFMLTKNNNTFNISEDTLNKTNKIIISFWGGSGSHIVSGTIKPMLYQDGDGTWEPFTGGMPSPNPEYPQEIKSFDVKEVKSIGKNLCNGYKKERAYSNNNGNVMVYSEYNCSNLIPVIDGITYTESNGLNMQITDTHYFDSNKKWISRTSGNSINERPNGTSYIGLNYKTNEDIKWVQVEVGTVATSFEKHHLLSTPLNLTLRSLPNGAKDTYENGMITRRVGVVEFDGSDDENWALQSINSYGISNFRFVYATPVNNSVISNRFVSQKQLIADAKTEGIFNNTDQIFIRISKDKASTVEEFKTYLKTHKTIAFIEKTPTTEQVTLPIIPSYYPFTNAFHDSEVESNITWSALLPYAFKNYVEGMFKAKQLLINNDFQINQRGDKEYTTDGNFTLDMWLLKQGLSIKPIANGITVSKRSGASIFMFMQNIPHQMENGKNYTFSIKCGGQIYSKTFVYDNTKQTSSLNAPFVFENSNIGVKVFNFNGKDAIQIYLKLNTLDFEYIDLFEGDIAYPHVKRKYYDDLMECQMVEPEILLWSGSLPKGQIAKVKGVNNFKKLRIYVKETGYIYLEKHNNWQNMYCGVDYVYDNNNLFKFATVNVYSNETLENISCGYCPFSQIANGFNGKDIVEVWGLV